MEDVPASDASTHRLANPMAAAITRLGRLHDRLCPRQVLGIRVGLYAAELLGVPVPQADKRLLAFVETDGCFADGVTAATGCALGHRTMRLVDHGKVAVTVVDMRTGRAVRVWPHPDARRRAAAYAPTAAHRWLAQRDGYQVMPANELLLWEVVRLRFDVAAIVAHPGLRAVCDRCGEEVTNGREIERNEETLCPGCGGDRYYERVVDGVGISQPVGPAQRSALLTGVASG